MSYDGLEMLRAAQIRNNIHLSLLIAETSIWAHPEVHRILVKENQTGSYFPMMRRYRVGKGERKGGVVDGVRLDDNSYANHAIKQATGISRDFITNFEACHIWPDSCYDARCHTVIANLVLLPRPLAGLSDHDPEIQLALQYRAFELYGWFPPEAHEPRKPEFYPTNWSAPMPFTDKITRSLANRRI